MAKKKTEEPAETPAEERTFPTVDKEMTDAIFRAELEWEERLRVCAVKKAEAKEAKDDADAAGERVRELLVEARSGQKALPFSGVLGEGEKWDAPPNVRGIGLTAVEPAIHPGTLEKLEAAGMVTVGDVIDEVRRNHTLCGINGVGKRGADTVMKAIEAFLKAETEGLLGGLDEGDE